MSATTAREDGSAEIAGANFCRPKAVIRISNIMTGFKDPKQLTKWTKIFLCLFIVTSVISFSISSLNIKHLSKMKSGYEASEIHIMKERKEALEYWADNIYTISSLISLIAALLVLWWIYRAAYNVKKLGANVTTTPIKSIIWYFVPNCAFLAAIAFNGSNLES